MKEDWASLSQEQQVERMMKMKVAAENKLPHKKWANLLSGVVVTIFSGGIIIALLCGVAWLLKVLLHSLGLIS
jgi:hypothetical protein